MHCPYCGEEKLVEKIGQLPSADFKWDTVKIYRCQRCQEIFARKVVVNGKKKPVESEVLVRKEGADEEE